MEMGGLWVMRAEEVPSVHQVVLVAEQSPHTALLFGLVLMGHLLKGGEALVCHILVFFLQGLGHHELRLAVLPRVLPSLLSGHAMLFHGLGHLEGRVHTDAVEAVKHLGVHAAHRRAYYEVGLLLLGLLPQQLQAFLGMKRDVESHDLGAREGLADELHRA